MRTGDLGRDGSPSRPRRNAAQRTFPDGTIFRVRSARCRAGGDIPAGCPYLRLALLFATLILQFSTVPVRAQYAIDWHTMDGGGGTSTGGVYAVSGTIGQPDAGAMSGGNFSLSGGFWSLSAVPTPGAPLLSITLTSTNTALVSWPSPSAGWLLQQNTNSVASVNWSNVVTAPTDTRAIKYIIVNPPTGNRFYRLFKP